MRSQKNDGELEIYEDKESGIGKLVIGIESRVKVLPYW